MIRETENYKSRGEGIRDTPGLWIGVDTACII